MLGSSIQWDSSTVVLFSTNKCLLHLCPGCTHSFLRAVTWLVPEEVVMTSRRWLAALPFSSLARRSNTSLLYTSITDTSTVWLSVGFSEISLGHKHIHTGADTQQW